MIRQKYNPARIQLLHQVLVSSSQQGHPREYDIKVDELKVVQRTSDPEQFFRHEEFLLPDTQTVTITFYEGTSNRNSRHVFMLQEPDSEKESKGGLAGVEQLVEEKINRERQQWKLEMLLKENEALKQQLAECEEYSEDLQEKMDRYKEEFEAFRKKRIDLSEMNIGKAFGFATEYLTKNHPRLTEKIPLLSSLSGFLTGDESAANPLGDAENRPESIPETEASFTKKAQETSPLEYDQNTKNKLEFFKQMEDAFDTQQLQKVVHLIQKLAAKPDQIDVVCGLMEIPVNQL